MAGCVQHPDRRLTQLDDIAAVVQGRQVEVAAPEPRLALQQVQLRIMLLQHLLDAVDMVVMAVGQQDIGDAHAALRGQCEDLRDIPCRVYNGRPVGRVVMDEVDEVFHRPELQGMDGEGLCAGHAPRLM